MKATGIVRRVDDLGRIVIPKEIRRTLRIREGDPLELFLDRDGICLQKYSALGILSDNDLRVAHERGGPKFVKNLTIGKLEIFSTFIR